MLEITCGSIDIGNRSILKSDKDTNAFSASKIFLVFDKRNTANVTNETYKTSTILEAQRPHHSPEQTQPTTPT